MFCNALYEFILLAGQLQTICLQVLLQIIHLQFAEHPFGCQTLPNSETLD